jgi:hypothetical protein
MTRTVGGDRVAGPKALEQSSRFYPRDCMMMLRLLNVSLRPIYLRCRIADTCFLYFYLVLLRLLYSTP